MPICEFPGCEARDVLNICSDCGLSVCGDHWSNASASYCMSCNGETPVCEIQRCGNSREILKQCYLCDRSVCSSHWITHIDGLVDGDHCSRCFIR